MFLYPGGDDVRRVAKDAGLNVGLISFNSSAVNNWDNVLSEATKAARLHSLLMVVDNEYGDNRDFRRSYAHYLEHHPVVSEQQIAETSEEYEVIVASAQRRGCLLRFRDLTIAIALTFLLAILAWFINQTYNGSTVTPIDTPTPVAAIAIDTETPEPTITSTPQVDTETPEPTITSTPQLVLPSQSNTADEALDILRNRGNLVVAASVESGPYTSKADDNFAGFEVDLVYEFASQWFTHTNVITDLVEFRGINVLERREAVRFDEADFLIGSVSYRLDRCLSELSDGRICTNGYSSDPQALVVASNSPISSYCDPRLDSSNTVIIVMAGTTGEATLDNYKEQCNFSQDIQIQYQPSRQNSLDEVLVDDGRIKVYKSNYSLLQYAVRNHAGQDGLKVISGRGTSENETYGMWLKAENSGLRNLIDETVDRMRDDGTFAALCQKHAGIVINNNCIFDFEPTKIRIAVAIDRTGEGNPLGEDQLLAVDVAERYFQALLSAQGITDFTIEINVFDTTSDNENAIDLFERLTNANSDFTALIGPTYSEQAQEVHPIANQAEIVVVGPSNTADGIPQAGDFIFRTSAPVSAYAGFAIAEIQAQVSDVALLYLEEDAFTESEARAFRQAVNQRDRLTLLHDIPFAKDDFANDYADQITQLLDNPPDLLIISGRFSDGVEIVQQFKAQYQERFDREFAGEIIGGNGMNASKIFEVCGPACDGLVIAQAYDVSLNTRINAQFIEAYQAETDKQPSQIAAQMFTAVQVVVDSLLEINESEQISLMDLPQLRRRLKEQLHQSDSSFQTPLGEIWFDSDGEICQEVFRVAQVSIENDGQSGQFELTGAPHIINNEKGELCYSK
ncbi:MAG: ABC transporter substrate-binding protein [Chloroflexota bacterium]